MHAWSACRAHAPVLVIVWFQIIVFVLGSIRTSQTGRRFTGAENPQLTNVALKRKLLVLVLLMVRGKLAVSREIL